MIVNAHTENVGYIVGWSAEPKGKIHVAQGFIPMNAHDMALVTQCGYRTTDFVLASDYHKRNGYCLKCRNAERQS